LKLAASIASMPHAARVLAIEGGQVAVCGGSLVLVLHPAVSVVEVQVREVR
jgi:hypothetical protein